MLANFLGVLPILPPSLCALAFIMCSKSNPLVMFALELMSAYEGEHMIFGLLSQANLTQNDVLQFQVQVFYMHFSLNPQDYTLKSRRYCSYYYFNLQIRKLRLVPKDTNLLMSLSEIQIQMI
jgi:hypothetical protein